MWFVLVERSLHVRVAALRTSVRVLTSCVPSSIFRAPDCWLTACNLVGALVDYSREETDCLRFSFLFLPFS
jgi:hypothetical protein